MRLQGAWRHVRAAALSASLAAVADSCLAAQEVIDRVLAVAAGNLIMLSDVAAARDLGLVAAGAAADPIREILTRLIERALVLAEVDRYAPPEPDAAAVEREAAIVRARFPTAEGFKQALARVGMNEAHLRETLRGDLRIRAYLEQRFAVAMPEDDDLERFYRDHSDRFTKGGQLMPFADVRQEVAQAAIADRRRVLVADWVADLRRRAEVVDLYSK
jgi:hypothetical protein